MKLAALVPHDPPCPAGCADVDSGIRHPWHTQKCDVHGCPCNDPPIPGITM